MAEATLATLRMVSDLTPRTAAWPTYWSMAVAAPFDQRSARRAKFCAATLPARPNACAVDAMARSSAAPVDGGLYERTGGVSVGCLRLKRGPCLFVIGEFTGLCDRQFG